MGKIGRFHPFIPYIVLLRTQKTPYIVIYPFVTALKSLGRNTVPVQVRPRAPTRKHPLRVFFCWFLTFKISDFYIGMSSKRNPPQTENRSFLSFAQLKRAFPDFWRTLFPSNEIWCFRRPDSSGPTFLLSDRPTSTILKMRVSQRSLSFISVLCALRKSERPPRRVPR